jgi:hypothetical protein
MPLVSTNLTFVIKYVIIFIYKIGGVYYNVYYIWFKYNIYNYYIKYIL